MEDFQDLYTLVKDKLREEISETIFDVWLSEMQPVAFEDGVATLSMPEFKRKVTEQKFMESIHSAFRETLGFDVEVQLIDPSAADFAQTRQAQHGSGTQHISRLPKGHEGNTFDTFVVGGSNKFAHAAALSVAANPGKFYNPLFIYGNAGLGKTHLLSAIYHELRQKFPQINIVYATGEEFTNEMIRYLTIKNMTDFHHKFRGADVLLVDDIQFIAGKEAVQEEFFHTFNTLNQSGRQIVLTSDKPPKDMTTLEDRLRSRFDAGLIADIQPPDLETRMAIIIRKATDTSFEIPTDIVDFIARQLKSNIRQLEGAVNRLEALVTMRGMPLNVRTAEAAIADIVSRERPIPVTIERIVEETARYYQLTGGEIRSKRRNADISHARQVSMYIISQMTGLSTKAIGTEFSRDHSTVVYALREIRAGVQRDPSLHKAINEIIKNVEEH